MFNIKKVIEFVFYGFVNEDVRNTLVGAIGANNLDQTKQEYYPYIRIDPYRLEVIIRDIIKTKKKGEEKLKFCDAGCGIPLIPKIVDMLDLDIISKGVEYEQVYCNYFRYWLNQGDIIEYDFSKYDIVYSYNPIKDDKLMIKALHNILTTMKKGAVLYFIKAGGYKFDFKKYGKVTNLSDGRAYCDNTIFKIVKK